MSLAAVGLVILAEINAVAERTVLRGASILDTFVLCPGFHRQQSASSCNAGEFPACAAMTTGYVFRVENPATVAYLQRVGRTGHLTTLRVHRLPAGNHNLLSDGLASVSHIAAVLLTIVSMFICISMFNWLATLVLVILCVARFINISVFRKLAEHGWHGAEEPGVVSDLLILLSYDRWIRIQGLVDDVKAVTSGRWLRDPSPIESFAISTATLLVYSAAALTANVSSFGQLVLLLSWVGSAALLGLANALTTTLVMNGRLVEQHGEAKAYERRRGLADELIELFGRDDWAVAMGMIPPESGPSLSSKHAGPVIM